MEKGRVLRGWAGAFAVFALVSFFGIEAQGVSEKSGAADQKRADIVTIDALAAYGKLEEPPVTFLHDLHTEALEKMGKDCKSCHLEDEKTGRISLKFKRLEDGDPAGIKDLYHAECVKCHVEIKAAGEKNPPLDEECRTCHAARPSAESSRLSLVVDKKLHYRHAKLYENEQQPCAPCHHSYDAAAKKTVPTAKAEEVQGACGYCHEDETTIVSGRAPETIRAEHLAVHDACISCHRQNLAEKKDSGPYKCAGCHGRLARQEIIRKNDEKTRDKDIRMGRKQPDLVLVKTGIEERVKAADEADKNKFLTMNQAPFNHKLHEEALDTCSACHHKGLESCSKSCHTLDGRSEQNKGGGIQLETAMHLAESDKSCVGCHAKKQAQPECAGCHAPMDKEFKRDQATCKTCHVEPASAPVEGNATQAPAELSDQDKARLLLEARKLYPGLYSEEDIPEKATIGALADAYEPSVIPHRKIVLSLFSKVKESKMAQAFHTEAGTFCQGCHHNSPASPKPPRCANCHSAAKNDLGPGRPGLKAAYHQQCMGCHTAMGLDNEAGAAAFGLEKPTPKAVDCTGCHKEKK